MEVEKNITPFEKDITVATTRRNHIMTRLTSLLLILLISTAGNVEAHARLKTSQPADGSTVAAPKTVTLVFSESAKVTALTIQGAGETAAHKLPVSTAEDAVSHTIDLPTLAPGDYVLTWRALSDDSHVTSGTVKFSVRPASA